jgi:predicted ArsR family transcriptional regulator
MDYTAHELASVLGVTVRSAHRILLQWMDASLVEIVGEEKVSSKGRPRQIYRLSFLTRDS